MPPVHANFHSPLKIQPDGRMIDAWGPNGWSPDYVSIEVFAVVIAQGNVLAHSTRSTQVDAPEEDWWLDAVADGELKPGRALAAAMAIYRREDGTAYLYPWTEEVDLVEAEAAAGAAKQAREAAYESGT
jgi:hypothetical protein